MLVYCIGIDEALVKMYRSVSNISNVIIIKVLREQETINQQNVNRPSADSDAENLW